jgi:hypothetical protein
MPLRSLGERLAVGGRMVRVGGPRQRFRSSLPQQWLDRTPLRPHLGQSQLVRALTGDDDEIHARRKELRPRAEALSAEPLHAISADCAADPACDDEAKPRRARGRRLGCHQECEVGGPDAASYPLRACKFRMLAQPAVAPEVERHYFL